MCLANNLTVLQFPLNSAADLYTKKNVHVTRESLLQLLASIFRTLSRRCDNRDFKIQRRNGNENVA